MSQEAPLTETVNLSIVDDDDLVRKALKRLISCSGYHIETYASAEEFLNSGDPETRHCLILDIRMPGLSGLELQRYLRNKNSRLPIIFISSHADEASKTEAMNAGAVDFLAKPFKEEQLLAAIQKALRLMTGAEFQNSDLPAQSLPA